MFLQAIFRCKTLVFGRAYQLYLVNPRRKKKTKNIIFTRFQASFFGGVLSLSLHRHPEGPAVLRASLWPKSKGATSKDRFRFEPNKFGKVVFPVDDEVLH